MKKLYLTILAFVLLVCTAFGGYSLVDKDKTLSLAEKRQLSQKPKFSLTDLFDGTYTQELESYYTDQFPLRDKLMTLNTRLNKFYYYSAGGDSGAVLLSTNGSAAAEGGENLQNAEAAANGDTVAPQTTAETETAAAADETETAAETQATTAAETDPALDNPDTSEAKTVNSLLVVGDRAMEVVYGDETLEASYSDAVNSLASALGSGVKTYSLVTPNSAQFYSPESMRSGASDQQKLIENVYAKLSSSVTSVDAYSKLRHHTDEYIYFRTDHHWTALGAYYAYTAFCEVAGLEATDLNAFQTGTYDNFLGTLYDAAKNYPQGATLAANPDTVTYYLPTVKTDAKAYKDSTLTNPYEASTIATNLSSKVTNKYLCFICGDQPIEVITTDVQNDKVICVLKESYGNAFVPFLTSHYSKIIVIDPREFNKDGKPSLNLASFAKEQKVTDLLVINYPFMTLTQTYINRLNGLAGK